MQQETKMLDILQAIVSKALVVDSDGYVIGSVDHIEINQDGVLIVVDSSAAEIIDDDGGQEVPERKTPPDIHEVKGA